MLLQHITFKKYASIDSSMKILDLENIEALKDPIIKSKLKNYQRKIINFLDDCEKKKLLTTPTPEILVLYDMSITRKRLSLSKSSAVDKILFMSVKQKINNQEPFFSDSEYYAIQFSQRIEYIRENSEELKKLLNLIINPKIISPKGTLGNYMCNICTKIGYLKDSREYHEIFELFQVYLRNSLSHLDYFFNFNENNEVYSMTWKDNNRKATVWDFSDLELPYIQSYIILNQIARKLDYLSKN